MPAGRRILGVSLSLIVSALAAEAANLTRGPYLQLLTTHGTTIVWNTDQPAACAVSIGARGVPPVVIDGGHGTVCAVAVDGLARGTAYTYVPLADGVPIGVPATFDTDDPSRPFTFLVVGDSGSATAEQERVADRMLAAAPTSSSAPAT